MEELEASVGVQGEDAAGRFEKGSWEKCCCTLEILGIFSW